MRNGMIDPSKRFGTSAVASPRGSTMIQRGLSHITKKMQEQYRDRLIDTAKPTDDTDRSAA